MSANALLIDFGSTYTKLRAIDLDAGTVLAAAQGPSTVTTDVNIGLDAALKNLERKLGTLPPFRHRLASSSAAGGLAMTMFRRCRRNRRTRQSRNSDLFAAPARQYVRCVRAAVRR